MPRVRRANRYNARMITAAPRRCLSVLLLLVLLAPRVRADEQNEVTLHMGRLSFNTGRAGGGTSGGAAYGLRYLRSTTPFIAVGMDVDLLKPADKTTDKLIADVQASTWIDSASLLGVVRVGPTDGDLRPNMLLGLGLHLTSIRLEGTPKPGFVWSNTGTAEKRTLVNSGGRGVAIKIQAGADYALNDNLIGGAFLAFNHIGAAAYEATDQGKSAGLRAIQGSMSAITFGVSLNGRF